MGYATNSADGRLRLDWSGLIGALLLIVPCAPGSALGAELGDVELHGFVSQGFLKSTANDFLARSERGSFEFTEVAINFNLTLTDRLRTALQLFTRDLGPLGNYVTRFDWFFLDWRHSDWLGLRAGRLRLPFGLYNATSDYDPGRTSILLPQAIYPLTARDFLLALTGVELYGHPAVGQLGSLEYRGYVGTSFFDVSATERDADVEVPYTAGGQLMWEPLTGLRLGGSVLATRLDARVVRSEMPVGVMVPAVLWITSVEYASGDLLLAAEYSRWRVRLAATDETVFPRSDTTSERFYVSGFFGFTHWLNAGGYYAALFRDVDDRSGRAQYQHDVAASVRFNFNEHWLLKLEAHYLRGTALLSPMLNAMPNAEAEENWGLFLAKTTAYF